VSSSTTSEGAAARRRRVDLYQSFVDNGGSTARRQWLRTTSYTHFAIMPAGKLVTSQYEGNGLVSVLRPSAVIYQDISLRRAQVRVSSARCEVVTAAARQGTGR